MDAFALHSAARARATARGVRGAAPPAPSGSFAVLPGRDGRFPGLDAESAERALADAERARRILERDPHDKDILEDVDELL